MDSFSYLIYSFQYFLQDIQGMGDLLKQRPTPLDKAFINMNEIFITMFH